MESHLDSIFSERLTDQVLLKQIIGQYLERAKSGTSEKDFSRINRIQRGLEAKRKRLLDAYFDSLVGRAELDRRLNDIKAQEQIFEQKLPSMPLEIPGLSVPEVAKILEPLLDWEFLSRVEKRKLLQAIIPEIHVENYGVTKLALLVPERHRDEINHTDRDSWPPPT